MIDYSKHKILIVDDEIEILKALKRGLHDEPYEAVFASSGAQALESIATEGEISVVITDMRMPGMNGLELLKQVQKISPHTVKIVLTGYTQLPQILATINTVEIYKFLTKPWDLELELKVYIREAIAYYEEVTQTENRLESVEKKGLLYNKMLSDSYEKVDHVLRLYDELVKAMNQHHLLTIQSIKGIESKEQLLPVIQQMNDRMHYLNKVFEMGRFTLKSFTGDDVRLQIDRALEKLGVGHIKMDYINPNEDDVFADNFKLMTNIVIDLMETLYFGSNDLRRLSMRTEVVEDKMALHFILECTQTPSMNEKYSRYKPFVESVVKIVGGRLFSAEIANILRVEILFPIKKKAFFDSITTDVTH